MFENDDDMLDDFDEAAGRGLFLVTIEARGKYSPAEVPEEHHVYAHAVPKVGDIVVLPTDRQARVTEVRHTIAQEMGLKLPVLAIFVSAEKIPDEYEQQRQ